MNIDGIQRLSREEVESRRKIVLGMIGEDIENNKTNSFVMDSVKKPSAKTVVLALPLPLTTPAMLGKQQQEEVVKFLPKDEKQAEEYDARQMLLPKQQLNRKEREDQEIREKVTRMKEERQRKIENEKRVLSEKAELERREKERIAAEAIREEGLKRAQEERQRLQAMRRKKILEFLQSLKLQLEEVILLIMVSFFVFLAIYFVFISSVLFFKLNGGVVRFIERLFIVPAIVINGKVIDYKSFLDLQENQVDKKETMRKIISSVVEKDLLQKHNVGSVADLENISVWDYEINRVPVSRIRNIKKKIDVGGDFIEVAKKYGEDLKKTDISAADMNLLEYGDKLKVLNLGDRTDIITLKDGYYIFMCSEKYNDKISVSYVYVKAKTAQEYINQAVEETSYLSFVE